MMKEEGIDCTPVGNYPYDWGSSCFYHGGYNILRHGSMKIGKILNFICILNFLGSNINATQIEAPIYFRNSIQTRQKFAIAFTKTILKFFQYHYQIDLSNI